MTPMEQKEIRGLNIKSLYWIAASAAVICSTVLGTYFSLLGRLAAIEIQKVEQSKYDDLRIRTLDLKVQALEIEVKDLRKRQDDGEKNRLTN